MSASIATAPRTTANEANIEQVRRIRYAVSGTPYQVRRMQQVHTLERERQAVRFDAARLADFGSADRACIGTAVCATLDAISAELRHRHWRGELPEGKATMGEEQDTPALREWQRTEYQLTEAQYTRFRVLLSMPAAAWPEALQRRVLIAIELEGRTQTAVAWAIADYVRREVPKAQA